MSGMQYQQPEQSYKEMIDTMKAFEEYLDKLQEQASDLEMKLAEIHFESTIVFDAQVTSIVSQSDEKDLPTSSPGTEEESPEEAEAKAQEVDQNYAEMVEEVYAEANQAPTLASE